MIIGVLSVFVAVDPVFGLWIKITSVPEPPLALAKIL